MKKIYLTITSLFFLLLSLQSSATIWNVNIANFSFSPNSLNVITGDTIRWHLVSGTHTATSTSVPAGANSFDSGNLSAVGSTFDYIISVAGSYAYHCSIHGNMTGTIIATSSSGITTPSAPLISFAVSAHQNAEFTFTYSLSKSGMVNLNLCDLTGKVARKFQSEVKSGGEYVETYNLSDLSSGIYIVQFSVDNQRLPRRIVVE
jgi:plastocyanin